MPKLILLVLAAASVASVACNVGVSVPPLTPRHSEALLRPEIEAYRYHDAYEMIERLRPDFLRRDRDPRGSTLVVVDYTILGSVESLRGFPSGAMLRVSRLSAGECEMRFGSRRAMPSGAIWIETR